MSLKRKRSAGQCNRPQSSTQENYAQQIADLEFLVYRKKGVTAAQKKEFTKKLRRIKNSMSALRSRERKRAKIFKMEGTVAELRNEIKRLETENMQLRKTLIQQQHCFKIRSLNQTKKHSSDSPHYPNNRLQTDGSSRLISTTNSERVFSEHSRQHYFQNKSAQNDGSRRFIPSMNSGRIFSEHSRQHPLHSCQNKRPQNDGSSRFIPSTNSDRIFEHSRQHYFQNERPQTDGTNSERLFSEYSRQYPMHSLQNKLPQTDGSSKFIASTNSDRVFSEHLKQLNPIDSESKHPHDDSPDLLPIEDYENDFLSDLAFLDDVTNIGAMDSVSKTSKIANGNSPSPISVQW